MLGQVFGQDIHADFRQKQVRPHSRRGADTGALVHRLHDHGGNAHAVPLVEVQIGCYMDEAFVYGIGIHIFFVKEVKVGVVNVRRNAHVKLHPRRRNHVGQGRRDFKNPAAVLHPLRLQPGTHRQAEGSGPPGGICHHQIRGKRIQSPGRAFHGSIKALQVYTYIYPLFHGSSIKLIFVKYSFCRYYRMLVR